MELLNALAYAIGAACFLYATFRDKLETNDADRVTSRDLDFVAFGLFFVVLPSLVQQLTG